MSGEDGDEDPSETTEEFARDNSKGVGAHLTWIVLGAILTVVLGFAYSLHGFWWQT